MSVWWFQIFWDNNTNKHCKVDMHLGNVPDAASQNRSNTVVGTKDELKLDSHNPTKSVEFIHSITVGASFKVLFVHLPFSDISESTCLKLNSKLNRQVLQFIWTRTATPKLFFFMSKLCQKEESYNWVSSRPRESIPLVSFEVQNEKLPFKELLLKANLNNITNNLPQKIKDKIKQPITDRLG